MNIKMLRIFKQAAVIIGIFCLLLFMVGPFLRQQFDAACSFVLSSKIIGFVDSHGRRLPRDWQEYVNWASPGGDDNLLKSLESRFELVWEEKAENFAPCKPLIVAKRPSLKVDADFIDRRLKVAFSKYWVSHNTDQFDVRNTNFPCKNEN